jgi:hypothetical protein
LTSQLCFCQSGYPKKLVVGKDTVIGLTLEQVKIINEVKIDRDKYKDMYDTCMSQKSKRDTAIAELVAVKESLLQERVISEDLQQKQASIVIGLEKDIKQRDKKLKWAKIKSSLLVSTTTLGVVGTVTFLTLFFIKR